MRATLGATSRRAWLGAVTSCAIAAAIGGCENAEDIELELREAGDTCEDNALAVLEWVEWEGEDPIDLDPELEELDPLEPEDEIGEEPSSPASPAGRRTYYIRLPGNDRISINVEDSPTGADFTAVIGSNFSGRTRSMRMKGRWSGSRWIYTGVDNCEGNHIVLVLGFGKSGRLGCRVVINGQRVFQRNIYP